MKLRINIGAGQIIAAHCGGGETGEERNKKEQREKEENEEIEGERWLYYVCSDEIDNTFALDHLNSPGNLFLGIN